MLLLFRYGMPFRVETKGRGAIELESVDYQAIVEERRYRIIGNVGLAFVIIGSAPQALGVLLAWRNSRLQKRG